MQIVYLNDFYTKEEKMLNSVGISCMRIKYPFNTTQDSCVFDRVNEQSIFRGPKMSASDYLTFVQNLYDINLSTFIKPSDFAMIADALEYTRCFAQYAPKVISFGIKESVISIADRLNKGNLKYPLFVRSNIESAAKYVGVESCILESSNVQEINNVLDPIYKNIANAESIIMKEIVPIKRINGKTVEYRAIVINGTIICFDYDESCGLPDPSASIYMEQFRDCINIASINGLQGAYFVDFGVSEDEKVFVVECKNIINGTICNVNAFAKGLKQLAIN